MCSLDKIKNRIRPSVALAADFRSWDIDVGDISETHLCRQKDDSTVAIGGYTIYRGIEIGLDLISERKVEFQYMCGKTLRF